MSIFQCKMSLTVFSIMNDDVLIIILSNWLEVEDLVRLDSAVCNLFDRNQLLNVMASDGFHFLLKS